MRLRQLLRGFHFDAASTGLRHTWPVNVVVYEVSPRDGLQNEPGLVPVEEKIAFIDRLSRAGFRAIETTSFVSPKRVPQLGDAAEVMRGISKQTGVLYPVLTPNMKGLERAMEVGVKEIAVFTAASEAFCKRNLNVSIDESLTEFEKMTKTATSNGIQIRGYVSCAVGCPFSGQVDPSLVASITERLIGMGCYEVSIGDTIGIGTSSSIRRVFEKCMERVPVSQLAAHMHDTYGQGLANVLTALSLGVSTVDASVAGLGGCPFAPGATGNIATEDVLYLLDGLGIGHGIDWEAVLDANRYICHILKKSNTSRAAAALLSRKDPVC